MNVTLDASRSMSSWQPIGKYCYAATEVNPSGVHPSGSLISTKPPAASSVSALLSRVRRLARSLMLSEGVATSMSPRAVRNSSILRWICNARSLRLGFTFAARLDRNRKVRSAGIYPLHSSASIQILRSMPIPHENKDCSMNLCPVVCLHIYRS
jgi:hypothetical protein